METQNKKFLPQNISNVVIDSGNLLSSENIKRKASILPTEEVFRHLFNCFSNINVLSIEQFIEGMNQTINEWQQNGNLRSDSNSTLILTNNDLNCVTNIGSTERQTFRITVKLFLFDDCDHKTECQSLNNGIDIVLKQLNISSVDSLILSLPNRPTKLSLDDIKPFWKSAQTILASGKTSQLGISDLDTNQLIQLYEWADQNSKPMTNHVNLEACCVIPQEMSAYAKQHNIQLLTHNDPKGIHLFVNSKSKPTVD